MGYKPERPRTVPFDESYEKGSDDLPMDQPPLAKTTSEVEPEQIHIALAGDSLLEMGAILHSYCCTRHSQWSALWHTLIPLGRINWGKCSKL